MVSEIGATDLKTYYKENFNDETAYFFPLNGEFYACNYSISFPSSEVEIKFIDNMVKEGKILKVPITLYPALQESILSLKEKDG